MGRICKGVKKKKVWVEITDVLHVPEMKERLQASNAIRKSGGRIVLENSKVGIELGGVTIPLKVCEESELEMY